VRRRASDQGLLTTLTESRRERPQEAEASPLPDVRRPGRVHAAQQVPELPHRAHDRQNDAEGGTEGGKVASVDRSYLMEVVTRESNAELTAARWLAAYGHRDDTPLASGRTWRETHEQLVALGKTPLPEDVNAVIGNSSWTDVRCQSCNALAPSAVILFDVETSYTICGQCLIKALYLLER
jgi:hypothetical protein